MTSTGRVEQTPRIRVATAADRAEFARMASLLWGEDVEYQVAAFDGWVDGDVSVPAGFVVAERAPARLCGFVWLAERPRADGCSTHPVGYVEGWFVDDDVRRRTRSGPAASA